MSNIYFSKAEIYKFLKSKGYFFAIPLFMLPLFSYFSVLSGIKGLVSPNCSLIEWNITTTFTNIAFNVTQIVYFIIIYKYYISEIYSGYFNNTALSCGDIIQQVKAKNYGITFSLLIIYSMQILFSTALYYLLLFSRKTEFTGNHFSSTYNIYALSFIIIQGILYCLAYPRVIISAILLTKQKSSAVILVFIIFIERVFENWNIVSYILPWNIILNYFLKVGNDNVFDVRSNSASMILHSILYVVVLDITIRLIVHCKKPL